MKIKLLGIIGLSAVVMLSGCGNKANTNTNTSNTAVVTATATPTAVPKTNETAAVDTTLKTKIEEAMKKKGFTDVTVDVTTTPATLRGTVAKGKLTEAIQTAQEAAGKPVQNQLTEK